MNKYYESPEAEIEVFEMSLSSMITTSSINDGDTGEDLSGDEW